MLIGSRVAVAALALGFAAACATLPQDAPKPVSRALQATGETSLGKRVRQVTSGRAAEESGFHVMQDGVDALAARLSLVARAERSIDAQYFLVHDDLSGLLFVDALLDAADRGVRVRLLVDDLDTIGEDDALAALDSHSNLELRVFNPFEIRSAARYAQFITELDRVDHRMHNKSFVVDNQVAIVGGRNIGDDYFDANPQFEFGDLDFVAIGPVVEQVSAAFDVFWNSDHAYPAAAIVGSEEDLDALPKLREKHRQVLDAAEHADYRRRLESAIVDKMLDPDFPFFWGVASVVYDDPDVVEEGPEMLESVRSELASRVHDARSELQLVTPYFVPWSTVMEGFRAMRQRGVRVVALTNSLASNDMIPAHSGYARYRREMLEIGIELYEVKPNVSFDEAGKSGYDHTLTAVHMKTFTIDRRYTFVGSFNWDPRSAFLNTEIGLFIDSPALGEWAAETLAARLPEHAYRVRVNQESDLEWVEKTAQGERTWDEEPETGFWRRLQAHVFGIVPEGRL